MTRDASRSRAGRAGAPRPDAEPTCHTGRHEHRRAGHRHRGSDAGARLVELGHVVVARYAGPGEPGRRRVARHGRHRPGCPRGHVRRRRGARRAAGQRHVGCRLDRRAQLAGEREPARQGAARRREPARPLHRSAADAVGGEHRQPGRADPAYLPGRAGGEDAQHGQRRRDGPPRAAAGGPHDVRRRQRPEAKATVADLLRLVRLALASSTSAASRPPAGWRCTCPLAARAVQDRLLKIVGWPRAGHLELNVSKVPCVSVPH